MYICVIHICVYIYVHNYTYAYYKVLYVKQAYFVADLYHMGPLCAAVKQYSHPSAAVAEDEKYNRRNDTWNDHQANQNFSPDANM